MPLLHCGHLYFVIIFYAVPAHLSHMCKSVATIVSNPLFWPFATYIFLYTLIISNAVPAPLSHMFKNCGDHSFNSLNLATYNFIYKFIICNSVSPFYLKNCNLHLYRISYYFVIIWRTCVLTTKEQLFNNNCSFVFFFFCRFLWNRLNITKVSILQISNITFLIF